MKRFCLGFCLRLRLRIASQQREAWIETEIRWQGVEYRAGIASQQREAWIETQLLIDIPADSLSIASQQREAWIETLISRTVDIPGSRHRLPAAGGVD